MRQRPELKRVASGLGDRRARQDASSSSHRYLKPLCFISVLALARRTRRDSKASLSPDLDQDALNQALDTIHTAASQSQVLTVFNEYTAPPSASKGDGKTLAEDLQGGLSGSTQAESIGGWQQRVWGYHKCARIADLWTRESNIQGQHRADVQCSVTSFRRLQPVSRAWDVHSSVQALVQGTKRGTNLWCRSGLKSPTASILMPPHTLEG